MKKIRRREFFAVGAGAAAAIGTLGTSGSLRAAEPPAPPQVPLGSTGIVLSRVGQGTGMNGGNRQSNHTRMGFEKLVALLRHSYDRGITFFDMADLYGTHIYFREALRSFDRDKLTILTKLWWRHDGEGKDAAPPDFQRRSARMALERFRQEISTDHLDIVLLHCLVHAPWDEEMKPYMDVLQEAKEKKLVRAVGVSCHDLGALRHCAQVPWVDVVLARINEHAMHMDGTVDEVVGALRDIKAKGKAIIGMKIYGQGDLADRKDECMKFAQGLGLLDCMTIGAETPAQMDETLGLLDRYPAAKPG